MDWSDLSRTSSSDDLSSESEEITMLTPRKRKNQRFILDGSTSNRRRLNEAIDPNGRLLPNSDTVQDGLDVDDDIEGSDTPSTGISGRTGDSSSDISGAAESPDSLDSPQDVPCDQSAAIISIMLFVMKHSLTKEAFEDLLQLLKCLMPQSALPSSVYRFKGFLRENTALGTFHPTVHHYCNNCGMPITDEGCPKASCSGAKPLTFHSLSVEQQLRELFKDKAFSQLVLRNRVQSDNITDIADGTEYQRLKNIPKLCEGQRTITFTMNTDGVALFSSSHKGNLWPVYLAINELPVKMRFSKKFLLTTHLFCQEEKPSMLTYLLPLMDSLKKLHTEGLSVVTPSGMFFVRCHLLAVTVDLPARAMVMNTKQFNGKFGCCYCEDEGANPPNRPTLRYYPVTSNATPRQHDAMLRDARIAADSGVPVRGIKGASPLALLPYVNFPKTFAIDWMHAVLLGVVKTLLCLWFDASYKGKSFYIGDKMALVNERLLGIRTPDFIARQQRCIEDYKHWKASECREWLLHYSVPVISGIQTPECTLHWSQLVTAMFLLNKESISGEDMEMAERCLDDFCKLFPVLYEPEKQTMNIHMLRHIVEAVKQHGPLYSFSCFGFESMNHHLKNMVHGTRFVNDQISFAVGMAKCLPDAVETVMDHADPAMRSLLKRLGKSIMSDIGSDGHIRPLGAVQQHDMTPAERDLLPDCRVMKCLRVAAGNTVFYSKQYKRSERHSYTVQYELNGALVYGTIKYFLVGPTGINAVMEKLDTIALNILDFSALENLPYYNHLCPNLKKLHPRQRCHVEIIPISTIKAKCVYMAFQKILSFPPNLLEHN